MRRLLPDRVELAVFAVLALICATIVLQTGIRDLGLSLMSIPVFVVSAIMGMKRSGQWDHIQQKPVAQTVDSNEPTV